MGDKIVLRMDHSKTTKNTFVYSGSGANTPVKTLYVEKSAIGAEAPKAYRVTLEPE